IRSRSCRAAISWTGRWRGASASATSTASSTRSRPASGATTCSSSCPACSRAACSGSGSGSRKTSSGGPAAPLAPLVAGEQEELGLRRLLHLDVAALADQALEVFDVLAPVHGADEDLPDVAVVGVGPQTPV